MATAPPETGLPRRISYRSQDIPGEHPQSREASVPAEAGTQTETRPTRSPGCLEAWEGRALGRTVSRFHRRISADDGTHARVRGGGLSKEGERLCSQPSPPQNSEGDSGSKIRA